MDPLSFICLPPVFYPFYSLEIAQESCRDYSPRLFRLLQEFRQKVRKNKNLIYQVRSESIV